MFKKYRFADGYEVYVKGFSKQEIKVREVKHGKLISVTKAW